MASEIKKDYFVGPDSARVTSEFLKEVELAVEGYVVGKTPQEIAGAVICVLAQRLSGGEARDLLYALSPQLQDWVKTCALQRVEMPDRFGFAQFQQVVADYLEIPVEKSAFVIRTVFAAMQKHLNDKQVDTVESQLPTDLKNVWMPSKG